MTFIMLSGSLCRSCSQAQEPCTSSQGQQHPSILHAFQGFSRKTLFAGLLTAFCQVDFVAAEHSAGLCTWLTIARQSDQPVLLEA